MLTFKDFSWSLGVGTAERGGGLWEIGGGLEV